MDKRQEWTSTRDELVHAVNNLGFPDELGNLIAKQLGSPNAMRRMMGYLYNARPNSEEAIVDEMLAIRSDIDRWKEKKASEKANANYNDMLNNGLGAEE